MWLSNFVHAQAARGWTYHTREIIFAFCWFEDVGARFESAHEAGDGPLGESVMAIQSFEAHQL